MLADPYRDEAANAARRRRHRTPARLMCRLPGRHLVFAGDSACGPREVARFCCRHRDWPTLVGKLHLDANPYDPLSLYGGRGRPPTKGPRRAKPSAASGPAAARRAANRGRVRRGQAGRWYKSGKGLVPVRWVSVWKLTATHRDEFLYATDTALAPADIVGSYCDRWNVGTTCQEMHARLGLETTRGRCAKAVTRVAPCPFGLYSVVALVYDALPMAKRSGVVERPGKATATFSDAPDAVRRSAWPDGVLPEAGIRSGLAELPEQVRELLLATLAPAA